MIKINGLWQEAKILTDGMYSLPKTLIVFLILGITEYLVGPITFAFNEYLSKRKQSKTKRVF